MRIVRKAIFWLHLTLGCVAGIVILTMAVTGALLAFERQINGWADAPSSLQSQTLDVTPVRLDSLLATLKSQGQGTPSELVLHNNAKAPVEARFGRDKTLLLSPWTAEIVGQPSTATRAFFAEVERIHRSLGLGMQNALGRGIIGAANLAFLLMLISGLYLWLPKSFNVASLKNRFLFRRGIQGRAREWNWHNVIGIWTSIPLLFIVVTGVIISYPWASNLLYTLAGTKPPTGGWRGERGDAGSGRGRAAHERAGTGTDFRSLDELAQSVKIQVPAWKSITVEVPQAGEKMLTISADTSIGGQPEKSSQFVINRENGNLEKINRFSDNNAGRKLRAWARFLHTGEEFGIAGEAIAALASLGAMLLVWTGFSMALRRLRGRQVRKSEKVEQTAARENAELGEVVNS